MEAKYGKANRIWVMDRGMASEENLEFMRKAGARYLVGTPKAMLKKFEKQLLEQNWEEVQPGVDVKLCRSPEGTDETFVLYRVSHRTMNYPAASSGVSVRDNFPFSPQAAGNYTLRQLKNSFYFALLRSPIY